MTQCVLLAKLLTFALLHFVLQDKLACYSRQLLTSYCCIPVPYNEKEIFFFGVSSRRSSRSSQYHSPSASLVLVVGAQTQITVMLSGLCLISCECQSKSSVCCLHPHSLSSFKCNAHPTPTPRGFPGCLRALSALLSLTAGFGSPSVFPARERTILAIRLGMTRVVPRRAPPPHAWSTPLLSSTASCS